MLRNIGNNFLHLTAARLWVVVIGIIILILIGFTLYNTYMRATSLPPVDKFSQNNAYKMAYFAGGCFWCTESEFNHVRGVVAAESGYLGVVGDVKPTYDMVSSGRIQAREGVRVTYDPTQISFAELVKIYFLHIDPTDASGQFNDKGYQYSPIVYTLGDEEKTYVQDVIERIDQSRVFEDKKVAVQVLDFTNFFLAEEYHQDYKDKNPIRYAAYREGSGRNAFIRVHYEDVDTEVKAKLRDIFVALDDGVIHNKYYMNNEVKQIKIQSLTPLQKKVTQDGGTETPFTNEYADNKAVGIYVDIVSGEPLYLSTDKFDSGTGWPSFVKPIAKSSVVELVDKKLFSTRTEVRSSIADSHLGHVFTDGPSDRGGLRYCMNSAAMRFVPLEKMEAEGYGEYMEYLPK